MAAYGPKLGVESVCYLATGKSQPSQVLLYLPLREAARDVQDVARQGGQACALRAVL